MLNVGPNWGLSKVTALLRSSQKSRLESMRVERIPPRNKGTQQERERNILGQTQVKQQMIHDVIMQVIQKLKICIDIKSEILLQYIKQWEKWIQGGAKLEWSDALRQSDRFTVRQSV